MNQAIVISTSTDVTSYSSSLQQCLKGTYNLLGTTYTNICTGATSYIPNGFYDYIIAVILTSIALVFLSILYQIITD